MATTIDPAAIRRGRVRGRYFRENFAQAGIDLVQIVPELVTNADAAIAAAGRTHGRIQLRFGPPDPEFLHSWKRELRRLRVPALLDWRHEVVCADDGEGLDAAIVDRRLGSLGVAPEQQGQRGLFGRGLRDVWLAQGGGRIQGVRDGRAVETWFFPAPGDEPYAYVHVLDEPARPAVSLALGLTGDGTRVTVPLAVRRLPPNPRLRRLVSDLVQLRPILEDPARELFLELPGEPLELVTYSPPEPDPERPVLFDEEVELQRGIPARIVVRRSVHPIPLSPSRAARRGGLVVRSGRAAHEATLAGLEGRPAARHLYGEVWCDAIERLQREALDAPRPQVVVRVDRGGLNEAHPLAQRLYAAVERILRPIVEAEERRAGARLVRAGRAITARDEIGLKALNEALRSAFDAPGSAGFERGDAPSDQAPLEERPVHAPGAPPPAGLAGAAPAAAMRFKQSPVRLHPGELIVRHHASGWVREIARKDEDAQVEAEFDPESGVVTVFEGRKEFRALEKGARRAGLGKARLREYVPYRMLEVEVAANAVYVWAAEEIFKRKLPGERPSDPAEYAAAVRLEAQTLRYEFHERLMRGFLGPDVFEGAVSVTRSVDPAPQQLRLVGDG